MEKDIFEYEISHDLKKVAKILEENGYEPVNQIVGYLMSGEPEYISSSDGARSIITQYERTQILNVLLKEYLDK